MTNLTPFLAAVPGKSTLTGLDWLAIACYFGLLFCVAWWVIKKGKDTAADYFLAREHVSAGRDKCDFPGDGRRQPASNLSMVVCGSTCRRGDAECLHTHQLPMP